VPDNPTWALRYLQGRAEAYKRGRVTLANVAGAVRLAMNHRADPEEIVRLLRQYALDWEDDTGTVRPAH
jgi:hypothetical protein